MASGDGEMGHSIDVRYRGTQTGVSGITGGMPVTDDTHGGVTVSG